MKSSISRSASYKKQVYLSFIIKGLSVLANLWQISLLDKALNNLEFSVWVTIMSFTNWILIFDIGVGNGLRNKVAELLVLDSSRIKKYVSGAYFISFVTVVILSVVLLCIFFLVDWNVVFNTHSFSNVKLGATVNISLFGVVLNLFIGLFVFLQHAKQLSGYAGLLSLLQNFIFCVGLLLNDLFISDLVTLSIYYTFSIISSGLICNIFFFKNNPELLPSIKKVEISKSRELMGSSLYLFVISLGPLILNFSGNILITQLLGPAFVQDYSLIFRLYFSINTTLWLITVPFWSSSTEAYLKKDFVWLRKKILNTLILLVPISLFLIVISVNIDLVFEYWIGRRLMPSPILLTFMCFYVILSFWHAIFSNFLNGIGEYKINMWCSLFSVLMNFVLAIIFVRYFDLGTSGVILATLLSLLPFCVLGAIVTKYKLKD